MKKNAELFKTVKWIEVKSGIIVETLGKKPKMAVIFMWDNGPTMKMSKWVKLNDVKKEELVEWLETSNE